MYPTTIFTSKHTEWPLQEYQERIIMDALSQTSSPNIYSEEEEETSYFSDRAIFQLNSKNRRQSLSNSLRCSVCQRRFHSQGNLSNHKQLYH